jgi:hypothetical protein
VLKETGQLLAGFLGHAALIGLPGIAAVLLAARCDVKRVPILIAIGLVASGVTSYIAFWAYYADEAVGTTWDFLLAAGSVLAIAWCWRAGRIERELLRKLRTPLLLWIFGSAFVLFLGFLHGGIDNPITTAAYRFSGELPSDNDIPRYFAEWFAHGGHATPPRYPGEWLTSDRPPLQIGYVLAQRGFFNTPQGLHYQILCVIENALWIPALWAVLVAVRLRPLTRSVAMAAAMVSDVAILHGFYVWPKLIAAAFLLAAVAIVFSPDWKRDRHDARIAFLVGALLALAMLSHGSAIFGVIPLVILAAFRGLPSWRWLGAAVVGGLLLMIPWTAYQHYAVPPGNRLLKWQLAGEIELTPEGTREAIEKAYSREGFDGIVELKEENFEEMIGWPKTEQEFEYAVDQLEAGKPGLAMAAVRWDRFYCLLPFLGFLLIGPIAMIVAWLRKMPRERDEWRFSLLCFGFVVVACIFWGLILFGTPEARTTLHVGSLAVPLLGLVACLVGMRAVFPRAAIALAGFNILFVLALYTPSLTPFEADTSYSALNAVLALAGLLGIGWVLFRPFVGQGRPSTPSPTAPSDDDRDDQRGEGGEQRDDADPAASHHHRVFLGAHDHRSRPALGSG